MPLNDWPPSASLKVLKRRARLLAEIRSYFAHHEVLEVETPFLSQGATTDPMIESFSVVCGDGDRFLHTSPEFAMKRLLASGSGDIYQICHVFRVGEQGRYHNPEFTLLEWYRLGWDDKRLAEEVVEFIGWVSASFTPGREFKTQFTTYADAFQQVVDLDPHTVSIEELQHAVTSRGISLPGDLSRNGCLDLLMGMVVAPEFNPDQLTVVCDYPSDQAALARIKKSDPPVAARFEVFAGALELANGFHELTDPLEQARRFQVDEMARMHAGLPIRPHDQRLLAALENGLPDCAGVALGVDRLLQWLEGDECLSDVIAFHWNQA